MGFVLQSDFQIFEVFDFGWSDIVLVLLLDLNVELVQCEIVIEQKQGFGFEIFFDQIFLCQGVFLNGFESGGIFGWSLVEGDD